MTKSERKDILKEINQDVENLNKDRKSQRQNMDQAAQKSQTIKDQINQLQPLRGLLTQIELPGVHPSQPFGKLTTFNLRPSKRSAKWKAN